MAQLVVSVSDAPDLQPEQVQQVFESLCQLRVECIGPWISRPSRVRGRPDVFRTRQLGGQRLVLEYTNVRRTACKRQKLIAAQAHEMFALLAELPFDIDTASLNPAQVFDLALR